jgi:hypothetical protein
VGISNCQLMRGIVIILIGSLLFEGLLAATFVKCVLSA